MGSGAWWVAVDQASDTVYVANNNDGTVSVINGARCNASVTSGCGSTPPTVTTGANPQFVAVDPSSGTVFAVNQGDNTLSAINTRTCNGTVTSGCGHRAPNEQASPDQDPGYNPFPNALALVPQTGSAYVVNVGGASVLSVVSVSRCNAADITGCRAEAPSVPAHQYQIAADPATGTIYASNSSLPQIDVLNGATCHAGDLTGCAPVAEIPMGHPMANVGAVDDATHTLYAADPSAGTVAVINTATCNATNTTGCAQHPPAIKIGASPNTPVINTATQTLYVSYGSAADRIAVVNAATCNATRTSGCGQSPAVVKVGAGTAVLASQRRDRHHLRPELRVVLQRGHDVGDQRRDLQRDQPLRLLAPGRDRDGRVRPVWRRRGRPHPHRLRRQQRQRRLARYRVHHQRRDLQRHRHCRLQPALSHHGHRPVTTARRGGHRHRHHLCHRLLQRGVSILNGSRCNALVTSGCSVLPREQAVGSQPYGLAINQLANTVYVTEVFQAGSMSILNATQH